MPEPRGFCKSGGDTMRRAVTRHYVVRGDHRVQHDQFARRSLSRLCRHRAQCRRYLWQLRYELLKFGLRPNASGPGAHASLRAQRKREFGDVVAVGGIEDDQQIAVARRKIDLRHRNRSASPEAVPRFRKKPEANSRSLRGPRSSLGTVQINWRTGGKWPRRLRALGCAAPS